MSFQFHRGIGGLIKDKFGGRLAAAAAGGSRAAGFGLGALTKYAGMSPMAQRAVLGGVGGAAWGAASDNTSVTGGALMGASLAGPGVSALRLGRLMTYIGTDAMSARMINGMGLGKAASQGLQAIGNYSKRHFGKGWRQGYNFFSGF